MSCTGWLLLAYGEGRPAGRGRDVMVELAARAEIAAVAQLLAARGVVRSPLLWTAYARLLGADERLRGGSSIMLNSSMTPHEVVQRLARGFGSAPLRITIPEGYTRFDIAERLELWGVCPRSDFLLAAQDRALLVSAGVRGATAEGYLFPDTYLMREGLPAEAVVRRLVSNWQKRAAPYVKSRARSLHVLRAGLGWEIREVVTLASIVEKEARASDEQPTIAGVFLNRLRSKTFTPHRLQADPTVAYGCLEAPALAPSCARFDGRRITRDMLRDFANLYNTYRHEGLPPGPISNPGLGAIRAVLEPSLHGYYYFVARSGGRHAFSSTLDEHERAVDRYQRGK